MNEAQIATRRLMLANLNQTATDWLDDHAQKMFALGQWSGMLNKIDPDSPHCVLDEREAQVWCEKATLYLMGYKHGVTHIAPASA